MQLAQAVFGERRRHCCTCILLLCGLGPARARRPPRSRRAGKRRGTWAVLPFQLTVNVGTCVMYQVGLRVLQQCPGCAGCCWTRRALKSAHASAPQVVAGQALRDICLTNSGSPDGCLRLTWWILIFSASQVRAERTDSPSWGGRRGPGSLSWQPCPRRAGSRLRLAAVPAHS
jgi:hypothetical protein